LAFMLLLLSKSKQLKVLGKSAIGPSFFNINEPILFGMPIVMNPLLMIPFIFAPILSATVAYFVIDAGLVDRMFAIAPWTTPPIINSFLDTGDIKASVLQIGCFLLTGLIYYPFFRMWDKAKLTEEKAEASQINTPSTPVLKA
jgi:PTS system cellobiose-specific IIC component